MSQEEATSKKQRRDFFLKCLVSAVLLTIVLLKVDVKELRNVFLAADPFLLATSFALLLIQQGIMVYSWGVLLRAQSHQVPLKEILKVHFIGSFFGTWMPSSIGIDIIRAYRLSKYLANGVDSVSSLFVLRTVSFLVLFGIALVVSVPLSYYTSSFELLGAVTIVLLIFLLGLTVVLHPAATNFFSRIFNRLHWQGVGGKVKQVHESISAFRHRRKALQVTILLSLVLQILGILVVYVLGLAFHVHVGLGYYFVYVPVIFVISMLPISVAGIGVREGSFVYFFSQVGASKPEAFSLSLAVFLQAVGLALLGGALYWMNGLALQKQGLAPKETE